MHARWSGHSGSVVHSGLGAEIIACIVNKLFQKVRTLAFGVIMFTYTAEME